MRDKHKVKRILMSRDFLFTLYYIRIYDGNKELYKISERFSGNYRFREPFTVYKNGTAKTLFYNDGAEAIIDFIEKKIKWNSDKSEGFISRWDLNMLHELFEDPKVGYFETGGP